MAVTFSNGPQMQMRGSYGTLGADAAGAFASFRQEGSIKADELIANAMENRFRERNAGMIGEASIYGDATELFGQSMGNKAANDAKEKASKDAKNSSMVGTGLLAASKIAIGAIALSDETTKFDVKQINSALETLRNLRPVTFHYKEEFSSSPERMHHGFIAQEFQKVLPDATYYDESIGKLAIDTGDIIGLLVRANQELETRIARLEATKALAGVN